MLHRTYVVIRNALLFYFLVHAVFNGVSVKGGNVLATISTALIFGILIMCVPIILGFFRISVNVSSRILLSLVISFIMLFLIYMGVWAVGSIGGSLIDLGLGAGTVIRLDPLGTLIGFSVVVAIFSAALHEISGEGTRW